MRTVLVLNPNKVNRSVHRRPKVFNPQPKSVESQSVPLQPKPLESESVPLQPKPVLDMNSQLAELHKLRADRAASERARKATIAREAKAARKAARKIAKLEQAVQPSLNKQADAVVDDILDQTAYQLENIAVTTLQNTPGFRSVAFLDDSSLPNIPAIDISIQACVDNKEKALTRVQQYMCIYVHHCGKEARHNKRKRRKQNRDRAIRQEKANARRAKRAQRDEMDRARDNQ